MPSKLEPWNKRTKQGNPTRSVEVNEMVKKMRKFEVRKQGAPSKARRALKVAEYESIINVLRRSDDTTKRFLQVAFHAYQLHMIARLDDTAHVKKDNIKSHLDYDFCLLGQIRWSKNVSEERDAPNKIIFGAMDTRYCVLLALAMHLEVWFASPEGSTPVNDFIFGIGGEDKDKGPARTKTTIYNCLRNYVFKHEDFRHDEVAGPLGTHSFRKLPASLARKKGCSRDDVDSRGRWRKVRVSDSYIDVTLPYNDAKVASKLCVGGAIKYEL